MDGRGEFTEASVAKTTDSPAEDANASRAQASSGAKAGNGAATPGTDGEEDLFFQPVSDIFADGVNAVTSQFSAGLALVNAVQAQQRAQIVAEATVSATVRRILAINSRMGHAASGGASGHGSTGDGSVGGTTSGGGARPATASRGGTADA